MRRMMSAVLLIGLTLATVSSLCTREVKVKIEGNLPDAVKLVERLNDNGAKHGLQFKLVEQEYEFRIATSSEGWATSDVLFGTGGADASAAVLTPDCKLLFIVARSGRMSQSGALNAVSKEIVKKLSRYLEATGGFFQVEQSRSERKPPPGGSGLLGAQRRSRAFCGKP